MYVQVCACVCMHVHVMRLHITLHNPSPQWHQQRFLPLPIRSHLPSRMVLGNISSGTCTNVATCAAAAATPGLRSPSTVITSSGSPGLVAFREQATSCQVESACQLPAAIRRFQWVTSAPHPVAEAPRPIGSCHELETCTFVSVTACKGDTTYSRDVNVKLAKPGGYMRHPCRSAELGFAPKRLGLHALEKNVRCAGSSLRQSTPAPVADSGRSAGR